MVRSHTRVVRARWGLWLEEGEREPNVCSRGGHTSHSSISSMPRTRRRQHDEQRAVLLLAILGVWCVFLGGRRGVDAFAAPGRLRQQQRLADSSSSSSSRRSCLARGGPQSIKRRCVVALRLFDVCLCLLLLPCCDRWPLQDPRQAEADTETTRFTALLVGGSCSCCEDGGVGVEWSVNLFGKKCARVDVMCKLCLNGSAWPLLSGNPGSGAHAWAVFPSCFAYCDLAHVWGVRSQCLKLRRRGPAKVYSVLGIRGKRQEGNQRKNLAIPALYVDARRRSEPLTPPLTSRTPEKAHGVRGRTPCIHSWRMKSICIALAYM